MWTFPVPSPAGRIFANLILTKINSCEQAFRGIRADECVQVARLIEETGCCDAIEVSAGTNENIYIMARGDMAVEGILKYYRPWATTARYVL